MAMGWTTEESLFDSQEEQEIIFPKRQTTPMDRRSSYSVGFGDSVPRVQKPGRKADQTIHPYLLQKLRVSGVLPHVHTLSRSAQEQLYLYCLLVVHTTYEDGAECSETTAHKIQTPKNHPKEIIQL
jgi:hypothetical protein